MKTAAGFISALFSSSRFSEEQFRTEYADLQEFKGEKLHTQTNTSFEIAYPEASGTSEFIIVIDYRASVRGIRLQNDICKYSCKFYARFEVLGFSGFDSWSNMPPDAPAPYFSFSDYLVRQRALNHFRAAGFDAVQLPIPEQLRNLHQVPRENGVY
jgi:hypothetical protein